VGDDGLQDDVADRGAGAEDGGAVDPVRRRCRACYRMGQTYADRQNVKRVSTVTFLISIISRGNIGGRRRGQRGGGRGRGGGREGRGEKSYENF